MSAAPRDGNLPVTTRRPTVDRGSPPDRPEDGFIQFHGAPFARFWIGEPLPGRTRS